MIESKMGSEEYDNYNRNKVKIGNNKDTYGVTKSLFGENVAEAKVYAYHTHRVYKIATSDFLPCDVSYNGFQYACDEANCIRRYLPVEITVI